MGTFFTKFSLFFHKVCFTINTLFPPLHEMLFAGCVKLFTEGVGALKAHSVSARRCPQNCVLGVHQNYKSRRVLSRDCREDD
jgi:hypothetical protein